MYILVLRRHLYQMISGAGATFLELEHVSNKPTPITYDSRSQRNKLVM